MELKDMLNKQIANWNVLYVKLHNYHWYVKGDQFFTLHAKFEEFYNEAAIHIDELAERLLTIGGKPVASLREFLEYSTVKDATGQENAEQMVETLAADFSTVIDELKESMEAAEKANDETTSDMLLGIHSSLEKHVWMLRAYLGKTM